MNKTIEYKDSGIKWAGKIPSEWATCLLKYMFRIEKRIAGTEGLTVLSITQSGIKPKNMKAQGQFAQDYSKYQLVFPGDFAMNHMDLLTGWVDISEYSGVTSPDYRVFVNRDDSKFISEYYKYVFQYCYSNKIFYGLGQGVAGFGRWRLPTDVFLNLRLPVPSVEEQKAIVSYLDSKTTEIDEAISESKASIEEYKKLKTSIAHESITKGLQQSVGMKYSGFPDIGQIPESWRIGVVKNCFSIVCGATPTDNPQNWGGDINWIGPSDMPMFGTISSGKRSISETGYKSCGTTLVPPNSIVLSTRAPIGKICITEQELCTNQGCKVLVPKEGVYSKFYAYWLLSITERLKQDGTGTTFKELSTAKLKEEPIAILPFDEQLKIARYIDTRFDAIDSIIMEKELLIQELHSFKKSLIFETITGKRKVV